MKKSLAGAVMLALALAGAAAATWEGSAITGGAGDFPAEGMYAACNSFPRDSLVELSNIETGKTVTVTIISNVDNPGVFIALSPKTAEALGMKPGAAARVRAASLAVSQAEATLPAARAGVSADPDFNPRVFFEREKAALQAAAASESPAVAQAPVAAPVQAPVPTAQTPAAPAPATVAQAPAVEPAPAAASVTAAPTPAAAAQAPSTAAATPAAPVAEPAAPTPQPSPAIQTTIPAPRAEQKAEVLARAEAAPVEAPPAVQGLKEPQPASPATVVTQAPAAPPVQAPATAPAAPKVEQKAEVLARARAESLGGPLGIPGLSEPQPIVAEVPAAEAPAAPALTAQAPAAATIDTLARPAGKSEGQVAASLAEPKAPEEIPSGKPEAVLSRVSAPASPSNLPLFAEAEPVEKHPVAPTERGAEALALSRPASAGSAQPSDFGEMAEAELPGAPEAAYVQRPATPGPASNVELAEAADPASAEAIGSARPALAAAAKPVELALGEPVAPKEPAQTGVVAIGGARPSPAAPTVAEVADPEIPTPSESLVAAKPGKAEAAIAVVEEPGVRSPAQTGSAPIAIAAEHPSPAAPSISVAGLAEPSPASEPPSGAFVAAKPDRATAPAVALAAPTPPSPTESLSAARPAAPAAAGETIVALEPALPRPPAAAAAQPAAPAEGTPATAPTAAPPTAVATIKGTGGIAEPPASLPVIKGLAKGSYYIQIGVYGTNDALVSATEGLRSRYPVAIERISTKAGSSAYRLYIGPIARDESGLALLKIRSMGYKDAFVKQGT